MVSDGQYSGGVATILFLKPLQIKQSRDSKWHTGELINWVFYFRATILAKPLWGLYLGIYCCLEMLYNKVCPKMLLHHTVQYYCLHCLVTTRQTLRENVHTWWPASSTVLTSVKKILSSIDFFNTWCAKIESFVTISNRTWQQLLVLHCSEQYTSCVHLQSLKPLFFVIFLPYTSTKRWVNDQWQQLLVLHCSEQYTSCVHLQSLKLLFFVIFLLHISFVIFLPHISTKRWVNDQSYSCPWAGSPIDSKQLKWAETLDWKIPAKTFVSLDSWMFFICIKVLSHVWVVSLCGIFHFFNSWALVRVFWLTFPLWMPFNTPTSNCRNAAVYNKCNWWIISLPCSKHLFKYVNVSKLSTVSFDTILLQVYLFPVKSTKFSHFFKIWSSDVDQVATYIDKTSSIWVVGFNAPAEAVLTASHFFTICSKIDQFGIGLSTTISVWVQFNVPTKYMVIASRVCSKVSQCVTVRTTKNKLHSCKPTLLADTQLFPAVQGRTVGCDIWNHYKSQMYTM